MTKTKLTLHDSFDSKLLRWAGAGMITFLVGAFLSVATAGRADAGAASTSIEDRCPATAVIATSTADRC